MGEITDKNQIFEKVQSIVHEILNINKNEIKIDSKIVQDLGAESLDVVTLLMELEDHFDSKISDEVAFKFITINDVVNYVAEMK